MKTTQKSALLALATAAMLGMVSPLCAQDAAGAAQEAKPKQGHIKIVIEKNGKKEVIDEKFEGEMSQELKERIKAISGSDFTFSLGGNEPADGNRQIFISKFRGKGDTVTLGEGLEGAPGRRIIIKRFDHDTTGTDGFDLSTGEIEGEKNIIIRRFDKNNNTEGVMIRPGDKDIRVLPAPPEAGEPTIRIFRGGEVIKCDSLVDQFRKEIDREMIDKDGNRVIIVRKIIICDIEKTTEKSSEARKEESKTAEKEFGSSMSDLNFYPNPTAGRINLNFKLEKKGDTEITIHDVTGKQVYSEKLKDFSGTYSKEIDLSGYGKGSYIMKVTQGKKSLTKKIVVE